MYPGVETLYAKIKNPISRGEPIKFILCGFSMKSTNTELKVLRQHLDLAEVVGLLSLYHICKEICSIHEPGAQVVLYTREPFLYHMNALVKKYLEVPLCTQENIENYQRHLKHIIRHFEPFIIIGEIENIRELYDTYYSKITTKSKDETGYKAFMESELNCSRFIEAAYETLFKKVLKTLPQLQNGLLKNITTFKEFTEYCSSDVKKHEKLYSQVTSKLGMRKLLSTVAQELGICAACGADNMRVLSSTHIPEYASYIRLSVHPSQDVSVKLGINLVFGFRGTPWHNTLFLRANGASLIARKNLKEKLLKDSTVKGTYFAHLPQELQEELNKYELSSRSQTIENYTIDGLSLEYVYQESK